MSEAAQVAARGLRLALLDRARREWRAGDFLAVDEAMAFGALSYLAAALVGGDSGERASAERDLRGLIEAGRAALEGEAAR